MANKEHLDVVRAGTNSISRWRATNRPRLDLTGADLVGADLFCADLADADLRGADLMNARLTSADLTRAHLSRAILFKADLTGAILRKADLSRAILNRAEVDQADLSRADLSDAELSRANLSHVLLAGADLARADLKFADLSEASLRGANLTDAVLRNTDLSRADLADATLERTNLRGANLTRTNLRNANLSEAGFSHGFLCHVDLSAARGLTSVEHGGPSSLALDAIARSKGQIPIEFLKGCGLQDWEIENTKLYREGLTPHEITDIQYRVHELRADAPVLVCPLFISYSHEDATFVDRVEPALNKNRIRFWRDIHDLEAGRVDAQIEKSIFSIEPVVLLVLSRASVGSNWVEWEIETASELESKLGRPVLCPVALDNSWTTCNWSRPLLNQIKKQHIVDLSGWKDNETFHRQFGKVLRGIQRNFGVSKEPDG